MMGLNESYQESIRPPGRRLAEVKIKAIDEMTQQIQERHTAEPLEEAKETAQDMFDDRWKEAETYYQGAMSRLAASIPPLVEPLAGMAKHYSQFVDEQQKRNADSLRETFKAIQAIFEGDGYMTTETAHTLVNLMAESHGYR